MDTGINKYKKSNSTNYLIDNANYEVTSFVNTESKSTVEDKIKELIKLKIKSKIL